MWPVMTYPSIDAVRADAVFVSGLQRYDKPSAGQVRQAVAAAIGRLGARAVPDGWRRSLAIIPRRH